jgi:hypothetical protein
VAALVEADWVLVALAISYSLDDKQSTGVLWINEVAGNQKQFSKVFYDSPNYTHVIGAELNTQSADNTLYTSYYKGFIYQICVNNFA